LGRVIRLILGFLKAQCLRARGVRISPLAMVSPECRFEGVAYIDRFCYLQQTQLGRFSYVGYGSTLFGARIGRFCSIASDVKIGLGMHPVVQVSTSPVFYSRSNVFRRRWAEPESTPLEWQEAILGHDVWVGANALIMGGVRVGNGAVIAAGAVVTRDVAPYSVVGGVPAKLIRMRFPEELVRALLESAWWDDDESRLRQEAWRFRDPATFLEHRNQARQGGGDPQ